MAFRIKEGIQISILGGVFALAVAYFAHMLSVNEKNSPDKLQLIDISLKNGVFDVKIKNLSDRQILVKEFQFNITEYRQGKCGPLLPSFSYSLDLEFNNRHSLVNSTKEKPVTFFSIQLSHVVEAKKLDRFTVKMKTNQSKLDKCQNGARIVGVVGIIYDQSGEILSNSLTGWLPKNGV